MSNRVYRFRPRERREDRCIRRERLELLLDSILDLFDRLDLDEDDLRNIRENELFALLGLFSQLGYFSLLAFLSRDVI